LSRWGYYSIVSLPYPYLLPRPQGYVKDAQSQEYCPFLLTRSPRVVIQPEYLGICPVIVLVLSCTMEMGHVLNDWL
jgi:hypothetical protein